MVRRAAGRALQGLYVLYILKYEYCAQIDGSLDQHFEHRIDGRKKHDSPPPKPKQRGNLTVYTGAAVAIWCCGALHRKRERTVVRAASLCKESKGQCDWLWLEEPKLRTKLATRYPLRVLSG